MKRFFVFTLTALFATTFLFLTNLIAASNSDKGYKLGGDVYGYAYISTGFNFPYATSYHDAHVWNYSGRAIKYYCTFEATVSGPSEIEPKKAEPEGWVEIDGFAFESDYFRFNMRGKEAGEYTITGKSDLDVKVDLNGDGDFDAFPSWRASTFTPFEIE